VPLKSDTPPCDGVSSSTGPVPRGRLDLSSPLRRGLIRGKPPLYRSASLIALSPSAPQSLGLEVASPARSGQLAGHSQSHSPECLGLHHLVA